MGQQNFDDQQRRGPAPIGGRPGQGAQPNQGGQGGQPYPPQGQYPPQQGYDPRQYAPQGGQGQPDYGQQQYDYNQQPGSPYDQGPYSDPPVARRFNVPAWFPRDPTTLGIFAAGGLALVVCLIGFCLVLVLIGRPGPAEPADPPTQGAFIPPTDPALFPTPNPFVTPTFSVPGLATAPGLAQPQPGVAQPQTGGFNPALVDTLLNPYLDAGLDGMRQIDLYVLDPATGQYTGRAQIMAGSPEMEEFATALNISNFITAPDATCPNHVTLLVTRADGSQATIGLCLKGSVIVRGTPGLGGGDLPMGPYFTDILTPFLPAQYAALLG